MAAKPSLHHLLKRRFASQQIEAMVRHFDAMTESYQRSSWENAILKGGKFVEAVLKALWLYVGNTLPPARKFKVANIITGLANVPAANLDDALRITIPCACKFIYDIASNRGARHDPAEVNPNEIDAAVVVSSCSWVIAEMVRYSQGGGQDSKRVISILAGLSQRRYPQVEEVDGKVYFHLPNLSARDVALLTLWHRHPGRVSKDELLASVIRHRFSPDNARKAVERLVGVVDEDDQDRLRLLQPGLAEAEGLMGRRLKITRRRQ